MEVWKEAEIAEWKVEKWVILIQTKSQGEVFPTVTFL